MNLSSYLQSLERERASTQTIKQHEYVLKRFFAHYPEMNLKNVQDFIDRKGETNKRLFSKPFINLQYAVFRKFARFQKNDSLAQEIKNVRLDKKVPIALTSQQVKAMIAATTAKDKKLSKRNALIQEFLYSTGVRVSEAHKGNQSDLNPKDGVFLVRGGKGGKDRFATVSKEWLKDYFEEYGKREENAPLFVSKSGNRLGIRRIQAIVNAASEVAQIRVRDEKWVSPHKFRSTYATHLFDETKDIKLVQETLGHASLNTTERYVRFDKERLKKVRNPLDVLGEKA